MSKLTEKELAPLKKAEEEDDPGRFHIELDNLMEDKLQKLDPEWMDMLNAYGETSDMPLWYA